MSEVDYEQMYRDFTAQGMTESEAVELVAIYRSRRAGVERKEKEIGRELRVHRLRSTNRSGITNCCKKSIDDPELKYDWFTHVSAKVTCPKDRGR